MGTKDLTDVALIDALSKSTPLTDEQRSVLITVVVQRAKQDADADRYRFLRERCRDGQEETDEPQLIHLHNDKRIPAGMSWQTHLDASIDAAIRDA